MRIATTSPNLIDAITDAWFANDRFTVVSTPISGTYLIHTPEIPAVEGVAVHQYEHGWSCEQDGAERGEGTCVHIKLAKLKKERE